MKVLDEAGEALLTLPDDVVALEVEIERLRGEGRTVAMVVIDPIGAFLAGSTDSHKDADVRRALAPVAKLAERLDLAVVVVMHLTKDESKRLIQRVSGAGAFVNAARSVLAFARDPDDADGEQGRDRVLVHVASNWGRYAPSLGARIESRDVDVDDGSKADVGYLVITGESNVGIEDLQRGFDENGSDCEEAIGQELKQGVRPSRDVKAKVAADLGCSRKTVERAAMRMAKNGELTIDSGGFPRTTTWELINPDDRSGDSGDSIPGDAVGTTRHAVRVPTAETASASGKPALSGDSRDRGDSPLRAVPTEEEVSEVWDFTGAAGLDANGDYLDGTGEQEAKFLSKASWHERRRYRTLKREFEQWRYRRSKLPRAKRGPAMMRVGERECKRCGAFFEPTTLRQRFCSARCRKAYHWLSRVTPSRVPELASQERSPCPVCGEPVEGIRCSRRYCSNGCRQRAYRERKAA